MTPFEETQWDSPPSPASCQMTTTKNFTLGDGMLRAILLCLLASCAAGSVIAEDEEIMGIRWRDLQVTVSRDRRPIVRPCSGFVPSGHLCGIIGPSGSGKSTFLAALGGVTSRHAGLAVAGSVWWQGDNSTQSTLSMRCVVFQKSKYVCGCCLH